MITANVTRYSKFPDSASYHGSPSIIEGLRTLLYKLRYKIKIGSNCKICRRVDIKKTEGAILEIGNHTTIADYTLLQLTKPSPVVRIGDHTVVGRNCIIASKTRLTIGNYVLIGAYCQLIDHSHGFKADELITNQKAECAPLTIRDDVWIGTGAKVLAGVSVGQGAVIGANSVVTKNIPEYQIWAGNPARFIKERD
jgi:acetyltransferase-like isoleucine patch superfamily enzyme